MKKLLIAIFAAALFVGSFTYSEAAVSVRGYYRRDGTYVAPHYRSNPDGNPYNNWSYPGNTNPYTGKTAGGDPDTYLQNYYGTGGSVPAYNPPTYSSSVGGASQFETINGGYRMNGILFCNYGYYQSNGICKNAPDNGTALGGSSFSCDSGFVAQGDLCIRELKPNAYWDGTSYTCNPGFYTTASDRTKCISLGEICNQRYGPYAASSGDNSCTCRVGYEFNAQGDYCVLISSQPRQQPTAAFSPKYTVPSAPTPVTCIEKFGPNAASSEYGCACKAGYELNLSTSRCVPSKPTAEQTASLTRTETSQLTIAKLLEAIATLQAQLKTLQAKGVR